MSPARVTNLVILSIERNVVETISLLLTLQSSTTLPQKGRQNTCKSLAELAEGQGYIIYMVM